MHHEPTLLDHPFFSQACRLPKNLPPPPRSKTQQERNRLQQSCAKLQTGQRSRIGKSNRLPRLTRFRRVHPRGFQLLENCRRNRVRTHLGRHQRWRYIARRYRPILSALAIGGPRPSSRPVGPIRRVVRNTDCGDLSYVFESLKLRDGHT